MKKTIALIAVILIAFCGCRKENHYVRFDNNYHLSVENLRVGTAYFGTVDPGTITEYVSITSGNFSISGKVSNGAQLTGSGTVSGRGKHKWTITLGADGTIGMYESAK
jgi:hypothetical protein